jgi:DNA helicase-2/ATP-dependent DNA helicase PcrA
MNSSWGGSSAYDRMNKGWGAYQDEDSSPSEKRYNPPSSRKETKPAYLSPKSTVTKTVMHIPSADFEASDTTGLQAGQRVEHQKFGFGEVLKMEGSAHNPVATVKFEHNGEKKIMLNYAKLRIVS